MSEFNDSFLSVINVDAYETPWDLKSFWCHQLKLHVVYFSGPVASLFNERYSTRVTMFIGGILSALGLLISAFAEDFFVILLTFGLLAGNQRLCFPGYLIQTGNYFSISF